MQDGPIEPRRSTRRPECRFQTVGDIATGVDRRAGKPSPGAMIDHLDLACTWTWTVTEHFAASRTIDGIRHHLGMEDAGIDRLRRGMGRL